MFLPWSFIFPEAGVAAWKNKWFMSPADRLCLVWAVVVVIFFSLSKSKMPGYILSATVACGILVARFFEQALTNPDGRAARISCRSVCWRSFLCFAGVIAVAYLSTRMELLARPLGISVADANQFRQSFHHVSIILLLIFAAFGLLARFRRDASLRFIYFTLFSLLVFTRILELSMWFLTPSRRENWRNKFRALAARNRVGLSAMFSERTAILSESHGDFDHQGRQRTDECEQLYSIPFEERSGMADKLGARHEF